MSIVLEILFYCKFIFWIFYIQKIQYFNEIHLLIIILFAFLISVLSVLYIIVNILPLLTPYQLTKSNTRANSRSNNWYQSLVVNFHTLFYTTFKPLGFLVLTKCLRDHLHKLILVSCFLFKMNNINPAQINSIHIANRVTVQGHQTKIRQASSD